MSDGSQDPRPGRPDEDDRPALLRSWRNLYLLVLAALALDIVLCAWLSRVGTP